MTREHQGCCSVMKTRFEPHIGFAILSSMLLNTATEEDPPFPENSQGQGQYLKEVPNI